MAGALVPTFVLFPTWGVAASVIALWAALVAASIVADYRRVAAVWLGAAALFPVADLWVETTQYVARNAHADYRIVAAPYNPDARVLLVAGQPASRHDADARGWEYAEVIETTLCEAGETRVLVLGAAGMTLGKGAPCDLSLTYVDIDPAQERIAAEFLQTERPGALIAADARAFLRTDASEPWPAIVVDTFSNAKIVPDHLLTVEFYRLLRSRLAPGGIVVREPRRVSGRSTVPRPRGPDAAGGVRQLRHARRGGRAAAQLERAGHRAPQPPLSLPEERSRRRHGHLFRRGTQGRPGPRVAMTDEWRSLTHRFAIGGHHGYIIVATDEHDRPLLLEIRMAKAGGSSPGPARRPCDQRVAGIAEGRAAGVLRGPAAIRQVRAVRMDRQRARLRAQHRGLHRSMARPAVPRRRSDRPARGSHPGRDVRGLRRRRNLGGWRALPRVRKHWTVRIAWPSLAAPPVGLPTDPWGFGPIRQNGRIGRLSSGPDEIGPLRGP